PWIIVFLRMKNFDMIKNNMINKIKTQTITRIAITVGLILLIPLFGNLFVDGWNWSIPGFIVVGALLFGTGLLIDFVARKIRNPFYRSLTIIAIVLALVLFWVELAVDGVSRILSLLF